MKIGSQWESYQAQIFFFFVVILLPRPHYVFTQPTTWAGRDTRSICWGILTGLNSEFSFSLTGCHTKAKKTHSSLLLIAGVKIVGCISFRKICGAFNKFPDFFVQVFKIVVDSWKFCMLLLYILWDDGLIFMSSGSNEQLQQELEYTLLKPDYHSWWISKMLSDTLEERYAIKFCFKLGNNATQK